MRNLNDMNDLYNAYDLYNASNAWVSPKKMYFGQLFKWLHREKQIKGHNCTSNNLFKVDLQKPINVHNNTAHMSGHKLPNDIDNNENT